MRRLQPNCASLSVWVLVLVSSLVASLFGVPAARGHEIRPAIADLTISGQTLTLDIRLAIEGILTGIDLSAAQDTDDTPEATQYTDLRAQPPEAVTAEVKAAWPAIAAGIRLRAGDTVLDLALDAVEVGPVGDLSLPRDTRLMMTAILPPGNDPVTLGWDARYGALVVRQMTQDDSEGYTGYLTNGADSAQIPRLGALIENPWGVFAQYIVIGFDHIIPKGLDHILFVLGLFFFSLHLRPLIYQVSAFTLAHTITLAMAILGVVSVPASIVEPLIAASIAYVAIENVIFRELRPWRPIVVFGFGLLHGLGFASVLTEVGLAPSSLVVGLIGFNVGVELGQLAVIGLAWGLLGYWFGKKPWWRARIAVPASVAIAGVGGYWLVERAMGL